MTLVFTDMAATEQIAEMLMRAEEFLVQRQTDPSAPPPQSEEHCTEANQDSSLPVKKLYVQVTDIQFMIQRMCCQSMDLNTLDFTEFSSQQEVISKFRLTFRLK